MIALWMIYATTIAGILAVAAALVERAAGAAIRQRRWIWLTAVILSVAIPPIAAIAPSSDATSNARPDDSSPAPSSMARAAEESALTNRIAALLATADSQSLQRLDRPFVIAWLVGTALALGAYAAAMWAIARRRRTWRPAVMDGERVLLARGVGPAVVGAVRTAIVVPEWSLELAPEQRQLMIEHERQHVRARDPLVLHATALFAVLTPWNLGLWWLNHRLRLAVELDCDARVLAGGRDVKAYGTLLLDVCSRRRRPSAALAPALLERTSSLTRRILAMQPVPVRYARSRIALGAMAALGMVVFACDVPTPEMLAPDGKNAAGKRLFGNAPTVMPVDGVDNLRKVVGRYFPEVARGEGEPAMLFVVRSSTGAIILTDAQPASKFARVPAKRDSVTGRAGGSQVIQSVGARRVASPVRVRSRSRPGVTVGVGTIDPNEIEAIDVVKHAAGVLAPKAVSLIVISLKPGASVPSRVQ